MAFIYVYRLFDCFGAGLLPVSEDFFIKLFPFTVGLSSGFQGFFLFVPDLFHQRGFAHLRRNFVDRGFPIIGTAGITAGEKGVYTGNVVILFALVISQIEAQVTQLVISVILITSLMWKS